MLTSLLSICLLAPLSVLASPVPDTSPASPLATLERRACTAKTTATVKYRTCGKTSCTAVGQYAKGTKVTIKCFVTGEVVHGPYGDDP